MWSQVQKHYALIKSLIWIRKTTLRLLNVFPVEWQAIVLKVDHYIFDNYQINWYARFTCPGIHLHAKSYLTPSLTGTYSVLTHFCPPESNLCSYNTATLAFRQAWKCCMNRSLSRGQNWVTTGEHYSERVKIRDPCNEGVKSMLQLLCYSCKQILKGCNYDI